MASNSKQGEFPWVAVDRGFLPVIFSHAAAILVASFLNTFNISQVSSFFLFALFASVSLTAVFFYHNLKVLVISSSFQKLINKSRTAAGKAVLITGCDSTLGAAITKQLDDLGFTVFAGCFRPDAPGPKKLKSECSGRLRLLPLDVTSEEQVRQAAIFVSKHLPEGASGVWAVIHCASWAAFGEVEWTPFSAFQRSTEVNLLGAVRVTQAFLPQLRATRGRVVSVVSLLGRVSAPARAPYCAAKFAVEAFAECLRLEMRRWGVDVVLIEPGDALTGSLEWFSEERVLRQAREAWQAMDSSQRDDYGEQHFVSTVRAVHEYTQHDKEVDMGPVLRSLVSSVTRTFPLPRYHVISPAEWVQTQVAEHLPRSVYDILYN